MNEVKENIVSDDKEWKADTSEWIWPLLILALCFGGWGNCDNPRISELEKKVARLEGQMSMIGGRRLE